ncbi:MAG: succinate dehydrogenase assembly factor 2 [Dokdonella sp.]
MSQADDSESNAALKRLRWRCRRGTRELDQLVGWWLDERYSSAPAEQQTAFASLLDAQDPDLWDWVMGRDRPDDAEQAAIIDAIRTRHQL